MNYDIITGTSFCDAVKQLQKVASPKHPKNDLNGKSVYRPLTLAETIQAQVYHYLETKELDLFKTDFATSSGIIYKPRSFKIQIVPVFDKLFNPNIAACSFDAFYKDYKGMELDISNVPKTNNFFLMALLGNSCHLHYNYSLIAEKHFNKSVNELISLSTYEGNDSARMLTVKPLDEMEVITWGCSSGEVNVLVKK